jgi:hypothetical protein
MAELWPQLPNDGPVLAEGFDLGHDVFRGAFRSALIARGITMAAEQVFWFDPPPEAILERRRERDRKSQRNETLETVRPNRAWYHEGVNPDFARYEDTEEGIRAIREFLLR